MYGVILTNARAMGEFGAVSVISGNIIGKTQTLTLFVESAYKARDVPLLPLPWSTRVRTHSRCLCVETARETDGLPVC